MKSKIYKYLKSLRGSDRSANAQRSILFSFVIKGFSILISLCYIPLFLEVLNKEEYGVWLTFLTIINWFAFFDIGLGNGLRNKLGVALANRDFNLCKKYISTVYAFLGLLFMSMAILFLIFNQFLNWNTVLNTKKISHNELYKFTNVVVFFFCLRFVVQIIQVIYFALQKPFLNSLIDSLGTFLSFILLYLFKINSVKLNLIQIGTIVSAIPVLLFIIAALISFQYKCAYIKPGLKYVDFSQIKGLMSLGLKFFIMQITAILIFSTANILVTQFYGPEEVTRYNICFKLFQVPLMINSIILAPIWSAVIDAYAKQDMNWLKVTLKRLNMISFFLSTTVIIIGFCAPVIFKYWLKGKVVIPSDLIFFSAVYTIINIVNSPFSNYTNGLGKLRLTTNFCFIGIVAYFLFSFFFAKLFNDASSVLLAMSLTSFIGLYLQGVQTYKIINCKATGIWNA